MSGALKLYMDFLSPPSRALYIILKQCGTPFEAVPIALRKGEHLTNEYKKINKLQKLPCITEGEFKLAESVAILRYLSATNRVSKSLYTDDIKERAKIDEFLEWQSVLGHAEIAYFRLGWVNPLVTGKPSPEKELEKAKLAMEDGLGILENIWLPSSKFVAGNKLTVADIFGVSLVQQLKLLKYDVGVKYPKTAEWVEVVRQGINPHFDEAHHFINKFAKL